MFSTFPMTSEKKYFWILEWFKEEIKRKEFLWVLFCFFWMILKMKFEGIILFCIFWIILERKWKEHFFYFWIFGSIWRRKSKEKYFWKIWNYFVEEFKREHFFNYFEIILEMRLQQIFLDIWNYFWEII